MSHASSSMPPLTEGPAEALAKKANQPLKGGSAAELPMAFLNRPARPPRVAKAVASRSQFRQAHFWIAAGVAFLGFLWFFG
jgi:hypothetical protein